MAVTDLTGTTWTMNDSVDISTEQVYLINFETLDGIEWEAIEISEEMNPEGVYYYSEGTPELVCYQGISWADSDFQTIAITGGDDVTNSSLISWLEANATLTGGESVSSLTGTTWQLNAVIDIQSLLGAQFNITFESNDANYTYILFNDARLVLQYDSTRVYYDDGSYWSDEVYRTITITGGTDVTNSTLIAWLEANATQQGGGGGGLTVTYNNNTIHTSTADDTFTLQCNGKVMASDVTISATDVDSLTVTYGGNTIATGSGTVTKTLSCNGKVMSGNVGVSVTMGSTPTVEPYITFSSPNTFVLGTIYEEAGWDGTIEYSIDTVNWSIWDGETLLDSSQSGTTKYLYIRGSNNTYIAYDYNSWQIDGENVSVSGYISKLLDYNTNSVDLGREAFAGLFFDSAIVDASGLILNGNMTANSESCYEGMFAGSALEKPPILPSTTISFGCYTYMFNGCTSLTVAPELPATTLIGRCYESMFRGCTSLTTAPALPATTLAYDCYAYMFNGCTSLMNVPMLPATTLAVYCYDAMFKNCTSLEILPALPATTLTNFCYNSMFYGCTKIKLSTTRTGAYQTAYRIPKSGTGTTATNALPYMFTGTGGTFTGTPSINTTYYTSNPIVQTDGTIPIQFTIGNTTYQAEYGMTWEDWVNSEYNTDGFVISGNYVAPPGAVATYVYLSGSGYVTSSSAIAPNGSHTFKGGGGAN